MKILKLTRIGENSDSTFGVLSSITYGSIVSPICSIIENSWQDNKQDISCIPKGIYPLIKRTTTRTVLDDKITYGVMGVPRRTGILFHIGNTHYDTKGCPLTVSTFAKLLARGTSISGGLGSKIAFEGFRKVMEDVEEATLVVE